MKNVNHALLNQKKYPYRHWQESLLKQGRPPLEQPSCRDSNGGNLSTPLIVARTVYFLQLQHTERTQAKELESALQSRESC